MASSRCRVQQQILDSLDKNSFVVFRNTKHVPAGIRLAADHDNAASLRLCKNGISCEDQESCGFTHISFSEDAGFEGKITTAVSSSKLKYPSTYCSPHPLQQRPALIPIWEQQALPPSNPTYESGSHPSRPPYPSTFASPLGHLPPQFQHRALLPLPAALGNSSNFMTPNIDPKTGVMTPLRKMMVDKRWMREQHQHQHHSPVKNARRNHANEVLDFLQEEEEQQEEEEEHGSTDSAFSTPRRRRRRRRRRGPSSSVKTPLTMPSKLQPSAWHAQPRCSATRTHGTHRLSFDVPQNDSYASLHTTYESSFLQGPDMALPHMITAQFSQAYDAS